MPALLDFEDPDLDRYDSAGVLGVEPAPSALPFTALEPEATQLVLGLAAMNNEQLLDETRLVLVVGLRVDGVIHLWSDDSNALSASGTLDPASQRMEMALRFAPAGRPAEAVAADARFLQAAGACTHLALRLPDGQLAPDRVPFPVQLRVEDGLVRLLQLLADVARLAHIDVPFPKEVDQELIKSLVAARRLLSGETVRGRWSTGQFRLNTCTLPAIRRMFEQGGRHELLHVAGKTLDLDGTPVPLGEIRHQFSDAVVESFAVEQDTVVLTLRAYGGSAQMAMIPTPAIPLPLDPHLVLSPAAFDELVADLEAPARASLLRELL